MFSISCTNVKRKAQASGCHRYRRADGPMVLTVLGMVAEMELGFILDRQRAVIDAAKAKGVPKRAFRLR
jgi:DNA invertase Pin-like site-specific DNA recombinase